jgi:hypothetical protein
MDAPAARPRTPSRLAVAPARVAAALTLVLLVVGCSGSRAGHRSDPAGAARRTGPPASPGAVSSLGSVTRTPCALLTRAEAERAAGQPLGPALQNAEPAECTFATSDSQASVILDVGTWEGISRVLRAVKTGAGTGLAKVAVAGLGDEAFALSGRGGTPILYVRKGAKGFVLSVSGPNVDALPDHGLAKAKVLAQAIAKRL